MNSPTKVAIRSVREIKPFEDRASDERASQLQSYGMHEGAAEYRIGADAFEPRTDLPVGAASETVGRLLRMLIASLEVLSTNDDMSEVSREACQACVYLSRNAAGAFAVVASGVFSAEAAKPAEKPRRRAGSR